MAGSRTVPASRAIPAVRPVPGSSATRSAAAAIPASVPNGARIQEPTDSGEVGLITRSMLRNRAGRPRSWTSAPTLTSAPPSAVYRPTVRSAGRPVRSDSAAIDADTPAAPPR